MVETTFLWQTKLREHLLKLASPYLQAASNTLTHDDSMTGEGGAHFADVLNKMLRVTIGDIKADVGHTWNLCKNLC
jgi:hypothetical protein